MYGFAFFLKVPLMCFNGESWRSYESIDIFEAIQLLLNAIVQFVQLNHSISGYAQPYPKGFNADVKMCMKKEDCEVLVLNSIWKPPWTRHRWANILRHVELALTVDMVTTWYVVGCWKSHKTVCFWRKTVACITGHWLGIEKTVGVQSISQRSLSSCEYVIVYIFVCIVCCQFGGDFFCRMRGWKQSCSGPTNLLLHGIVFLGQNIRVSLLWQPVSIKQVRQPPA